MNWRQELTVCACALAILLAGAVFGAALALAQNAANPRVAYPAQYQHPVNP